MRVSVLYSALSAGGRSNLLVDTAAPGLPRPAVAPVGRWSSLRYAASAASCAKVGATLVLLAALILASGCAAPQKQTKAYLGEPLPLSDLAVVRASSEPAEFRASFTEFGEDVARVAYTKLQGSPSAIQLRPGTYSIVVYCQATGYHAFPTLRVSVSAGSTYEVACNRQGANERMVRAGVTKIYPTEAR